MKQIADCEPATGLVGKFCLSLRAKGKSSATVACYRSDLAGFFRTAGISDVDSSKNCRAAVDVVEGFRASMVGSLKPQTINRKLSALRAFFRWAQDTGRINERGVPKIRQVPSERGVIRDLRPLSRAEQARLLGTAERSNEVRAYALLAVMLNTGMRISELRRLLWKDVRLDGSASAISIRNCKANREFMVNLDAQTVDSLCALRESVEASADSPVFKGRTGPLTRSQIANVLERFFSAADIDDPRPEMLRRTFEANMIGKGTDPYTLAYLMGYSRLALPQRRFSAISKTLDRDVLRRSTKPR